MTFPGRIHTREQHFTTTPVAMGGLYSDKAQISLPSQKNFERKEDDKDRCFIHYMKAINNLKEKEKDMSIPSKYHPELYRQMQ